MAAQGSQDAFWAVSTGAVVWGFYNSGPKVSRPEGPSCLRVGGAVSSLAVLLCAIPGASLAALGGKQESLSAAQARV